jgi:tetratricopeptide (TPR) repeat protein
MGIAAVALALAVASGADRGEERSKTLAAEELVHASMRDYDLGAFDKALEKAEQAYRLDPLPAILFNMAQCHRALKQWEKAAFFYRRFLQKVPAAPNRRTVENLLTEVTYRAKAEQLPSPEAPPVDAQHALEQEPSPKPPLPEPPPSAPAASVSEGPPPARHSHLLGAALTATAVVSAGFAIVGTVEVGEYLQSPTWRTASNANNWAWAAIVLGVAAAGSTAGAILTW